MLQYLTVDTFESSIATGVAVVDFYADRCGPCKVLGQLMPHLAEKFKDQALVAKVNSDTESPLTHKFGVRSLPTVIIFKDGQEVERLRGLLPPEAYVAVVEKWLNASTEQGD